VPQEVVDTLMMLLSYTVYYLVPLSYHQTLTIPIMYKGGRNAAVSINPHMHSLPAMVIFNINRRQKYRCEGLHVVALEHVCPAETVSDRCRIEVSGRGVG